MAAGSAGAAPLYARVERQVGPLARRMVETFVEEIPLYAQLPREQLDGEILTITMANLRLFFDVLASGRALHPEELADIRTSAARRAEERVPLEAVLTAYHIGGRIGWLALVEASTPDETAALVAAGERVLRYVEQVSAAVASAYVDERQVIEGEERDARRALTSALLNGEPADALAARLGVTLGDAYLVLALRTEAHRDEAERGVGGAVAARRKVRRLHQALAVAAGGPVLALLEPTGGSALLPVAAGTADAAVDTLDDLVATLQDAAGAPIVVGAAAAASPADVHRAHAQAQDVVRLARRMGLPPGGYLLRDVLLEYQLTRPSDALAELVRLLDPLERNPDLPLTLEVYLEHDLDRRSTAAALHIHPNTLDYRLRRVVELTGLDPTRARGLQLLGAAVAARRLAAPRRS